VADGISQSWQSSVLEADKGVVVVPPSDMVLVSSVLVGYEGAVVVFSKGSVDVAVSTASDIAGAMTVDLQDSLDSQRAFRSKASFSEKSWGMAKAPDRTVAREM
jgi:hypothetical protein